MAEVGAAEIAELTKDLSDTKKLMFQSQFASERKDRGTATILAIFMYDRIWLGEIALGIVKLITLGLCGIWGLIDIFTAGSRCDDYNRRKVQPTKGSRHRCCFEIVIGLRPRTLVARMRNVALSY